MKPALLGPGTHAAETAAPEQWPELARDLGVDTLLDAMAGSDVHAREIAARMLALAAGSGDAPTIAYRQAAIRDALANPDGLARLQHIVVEAIEARRKQFYFSLDGPGRHAGSVLRSATELLRMLLEHLRRLRDAALEMRADFRSEAFIELFAQLGRELDDAWLADARRQIEWLGFRRGVLFGATLGHGNRPAGFLLYAGSGPRPGWWERLLGKAPPPLTFRLHPRDEAGAAALSDLRDRALDEVANAMAQAAEHVLAFLQSLHAELAFLLGCARLHERLLELGVATCFPEIAQGPPRLRAAGLRDPGLALRLGRAPVSNDIDAGPGGLVVVTGANQGGKSTFLRSLGLAQLMLHAGMFVAADSFAASPRSGLFTHFRQEEDASLLGGKLEEELARMDATAGLLRPGALWLSNESFASTNEREGSEILLDVVEALRECDIGVWMVTHLFDAARRLARGARTDACFLHAPPARDGVRGYRLLPGAELRTSHGADVYAEVFGNDEPAAPASTGNARSGRRPS